MNTFLTPDEVFKDLFIAVQESEIYKDSKTFVDLVPCKSSKEILDLYIMNRYKAHFDLKEFIGENFKSPHQKDNEFISDPSKNATEHIESLWPVLKRKADKVVEGSSLICLQHPYIVPGGRFGEIYYWDSYFTILGLQVSGQYDLIHNMVANFADIIRQVGYIPNGNRTYFIGRSQPPFFSSMVEFLAIQDGDEIYKKYHDVLILEYDFWMKKTESQHNSRAIALDDQHILNRYCDNLSSPRMESHIEDVTLAAGMDEKSKNDLILNIRAACESGWDFSSRWFSGGYDLKNIVTTEIIPIDLNCLLFHLESCIAKCYQLKDEPLHSKEWSKKANNRTSAIQQYLWDDSDEIYRDYNYKRSQQTHVPSLAMMFPLYFKIASNEQASAISQYIEKHFLKTGGVVTTLNHSGQQWDAPNGWAPLQWITIIGLMNYGFDKLADTIANNWIALNEKIYKNTGKFVEKYNVENLDLDAGGGEYPVQDGFGWTNGVYLALKNMKTTKT